LGGKLSTNELLLRWFFRSFHDGALTYNIFSDFGQFLFRAAKSIPWRGVRLSAGDPDRAAHGKSRHVAQRGNSD
jgi:hypothetical protein